jgi:hypothetical protein
LTNSFTSPSQSKVVIPEDDPKRQLTFANSDDPKMRHVSVAGDTYTILVSGGHCRNGWSYFPPIAAHLDHDPTNNRLRNLKKSLFALRCLFVVVRQGPLSSSGSGGTIGCSDCKATNCAMAWQ